MRKLHPPPPRHFTFSLAPDLSFDCSRVLELRKNMGCFAVCLQNILTPKVPNAIQYFKVDDKKLSSTCSYFLLLYLFPFSLSRGVKGEWGEE